MTPGGSDWLLSAGGQWASLFVGACITDQEQERGRYESQKKKREDRRIRESPRDERRAPQGGTNG